MAQVRNLNQKSDIACAQSNFWMGWELNIARESRLLHEGQPLMVSISASGNEQRHSKHRHYLPGMSPPFRKQLKFLIFVFMLIVPFPINSAKPLAAFDAYVLKARAHIFEGVCIPIFATGYPMR